jgi:cytochrome c oxidase subunit 1
VIVLIVSSLIFLYNLIHSIRAGEAAGVDPWDARTLEWITASPPKHYNFDEIPVINHRDEFWHRKYAEDEAGRAVPVPAGASEDHAATEHADEHADGHDDGHHIHMPDPSYWPLIACMGLLPLAWGLVYVAVPLIVVGALWFLVGLFGWIIEPLAEGDDDEPGTAPAH